MLQSFKKRIKELVTRKFNIILTGPNGCGKTTLIKTIFSELEQEQSRKIIFHNYIDLKCLVNIDEFLLIMKRAIWKFVTYFKSQINDEKILPHCNEFKEDSLEIYNFKDLFDYLSDFRTFYESYLIIDGIDEICNCFSFKQSLFKIFSIANSYPKIRLIFVTNFDLIHSETSELFDFSDFISICYPRLDENSLKEIIIQNKINYDEYSDLIKKSLGSYRTSIININEIIFNIKDLIASKQKNVQKYLQDMNEDFSNISIVPLVEKFKTDNSLEFITKHDMDKQTQKLLDDCISTKEKNKILPKFNIGEYIKLQINQGGVHIDNLNNLDSSSGYSSNITESLSNTQKLLLLSAFFATCSSAKMDSLIFKAVKKTTNRKKHTRTRSLKSQTTHSFTINRLMAIYSSMKNLLHQTITNSELNIELMSDINTLIDLGLLRYTRFNEMNFLSKKLMGNINVDFATKIATDYNIRITDFIQIE